MKTFLPLALFIASLSVVKAEQKIRQCACQEQHKCMETVKAVGSSCFAECGSSIDFTSLPVDNPSNIGKCMEGFIKSTMDFYGCIDQQLKAGQSCTNGKGQQHQIESTDFVGTFNRNAEEMGGQLLQLYQGIAKSQKSENPLLNAILKMDICGQQCGKQKLQNFQCFKEANCVLKANDQLIKQVLGKCAYDWNEKMHDTCQCLAQGVDKTLTPFCQQLGKTKLPKKV